MHRRIASAFVAATVTGAAFILAGPGPAGADTVTLTGTLSAYGTAQRPVESGAGDITANLSCQQKTRVALELRTGAGVLLAGQSVNCRNGGSVRASVGVAGTYTIHLRERAGMGTAYTLTVVTPPVAPATTTTTVAPAPTTTVAPTTTTTAPTTTTTAPPPAPACSGVEVRAGTSIQAAIDANPTGTVLCIRAGTYRPTSPITPKTNQKLIGEPGVVVNGSGTVPVGIKGWGTGATGVVVRGLVVESFAGDGIQANDGWVVENTEIRYNAESGIKPGWITRNNNVHHNGRYGMSGLYGSEGSLIENNEIAYNNTAGHDWWDAGATKFVSSRNLTVRGNHVHDNDGPGLWTDGNNVFTTYENNRVENNKGSGILVEISYDTIVRNNVVRGNGFADPYWGGGAGIQSASSPRVEVYGNTVENNKNGILLVQQGDRGAGNLGTYLLKDNVVRDNTVRMGTGFSGVFHYGLADPMPVYTTWNNRFSGNTYRVPDLGARWWQWADGERTRSEWTGYGLDVTGTFVTG